MNEIMRAVTVLLCFFIAACDFVMFIFCGCCAAGAFWFAREYFREKRPFERKDKGESAVILLIFAVTSAVITTVMTLGLISIINRL